MALQTETLPLVGIPTYLALYDTEYSEMDPVSWAYYIIEPAYDIVLVYIETIEGKRRKGYGSKLLSLLKNAHPKIRTGYSSSHGRALCLKNGFEIGEECKNRKMPVLTWTKKDNNSSGNEKDEGNAKKLM